MKKIFLLIPILTIFFVTATTYSSSVVSNKGESRELSYPKQNLVDSNDKGSGLPQKTLPVLLVSEVEKNSPGQNKASLDTGANSSSTDEIQPLQKTQVGKQKKWFQVLAEKTPPGRTTIKKSIHEIKKYEKLKKKTVFMGE